MLLGILTVLCDPLQSGSAIVRNVNFKYLVINLISLVSALSADTSVFNPLNFKPAIVHHLWPSASLPVYLSGTLPELIMMQGMMCEKSLASQ